MESDRVIDVGILGAGAEGCLFGALLSANPAAAPTIISRRRQAVESISSGGITVTATFAEDQVQVGSPGALHVDELDDATTFDLVLLFNKSMDQAWATSLGVQLVRPDGVVASMQNGLRPAWAVKEASHRGIAGTTYQAATRLDHDRVEWTGRGPTILAPRPGTEERVASLVAALDSDDLPVRVAPDEDAMLWKKIVLAVINPVCAAMFLSVADLARSEAAWELVVRARDEVLTVARAAGVGLDQAELDEAFVFQRQVAENGTTGSTYQSLAAGRPTEGADTAGSVVEVGQRVGVPTPICELLELMSRARDELIVASAS